MAFGVKRAQIRNSPHFHQENNPVRVVGPHVVESPIHGQPRQLATKKRTGVGARGTLLLLQYMNHRL